MDPIAAQIIDKYFRAYPKTAWVRHHTESFDDLIERRIPQFIRNECPIRHSREDQKLEISVDLQNLRWQSPTFLPATCRLENRTYSTTLLTDVFVEYKFTDGRKKSITVKDFAFAELPLLLRSKYCVMDSQSESATECRHEPGGYFIIDGAEKVLLTQEGLATNIVNVKFDKPTGGAVAEIRAAPEDGTLRPRLHRVSAFETDSYRDASGAQQRHASLVSFFCPIFSEPVPIGVMFRALGVATDREFIEQVRSWDQLTENALLILQTELRRGAAAARDIAGAIEYLQNLQRQPSQYYTLDVLHRQLFPQCANIVEKQRLLAYMVNQALGVIGGTVPQTDRDHMKNKRVRVSGDLCFELWADIWQAWKGNFIEQIDKRLTYDAANYRGDNITKLLDATSINLRMEPAMWFAGFKSAFKTKWLGESGIAQELGRLSYPGTISYLRRSNLEVPEILKIRDPRELHTSQYGLFCPAETPDGSKIGFTKSLAMFATPSTGFPTDKLRKLTDPFMDLHGDAVAVWINGVPVGVTSKPAALLKTLRANRPAYVSISYFPLLNKIVFWSDPGRLMRPLLRMSGASARTSEGSVSLYEPEDLLKGDWADLPIDWVDAAESETLLICPTLATTKHARSIDVLEYSDPQYRKVYTHCEIHPITILSALTAQVPFGNHNASVRVMFANQHLKQCISDWNTNWPDRWDNTHFRLVYPNLPISRSYMSKWLGGGELAYGTNIRLAIMAYTGYNVEDSVILNAGSVKRGMFLTEYFHVYELSETRIGVNQSTKIEMPAALRVGWDYSGLDPETGVIRVGEVVQPDTVLIGRSVPDAQNPTAPASDGSLRAGKGVFGKVDQTFSFRNDAGELCVKVKIRTIMLPEFGDKFSQRSSQKGTVGMILPEEFMPYDAEGNRPDLIMNPHAVPSRMTNALVLETVANEAALKAGCIADATMFGRDPTVERDPDGLETRLFSGFTGEPLVGKVFMGMNYYLRLKHLVNNKLNSRSTGPRKLLTHQPLEGRGNDGGLRIGEMERDVLLSQGINTFLWESMNTRSDGTKKLLPVFDENTGEPGYMNGPYCFRLLQQELAGLHINMKLHV